MKKMTIYLFRHTETELGAGKRLIGQFDVGLSKEGLSHAAEIAERLKTLEINRVISSSLTRTMQMADIISEKTGASREIYKELNEINLGKWDGKLVDEIKKKYPKEYKERGENLLSFRTEGGENFFDLKKRVVNALREILEFDGNTAVVSHASVNKIIISELARIPLDEALNIVQDYGCCNVFINCGSKIYVKLINGTI